MGLVVVVEVVVVVVRGQADWFHPLLFPLSRFIASLPFLSGLFGFDIGQMVKLREPDREFY